MKEDGVGSHHQHSGQNTAQDLRSDEEKQANPDEDCGCFIHGHELANWDALLSFDSASGDRPRRPPSDSLKSLAVLPVPALAESMPQRHVCLFTARSLCVAALGRSPVRAASTNQERATGGQRRQHPSPTQWVSPTRPSSATSSAKPRAPAAPALISTRLGLASLSRQHSGNQ